MAKQSSPRVFMSYSHDSQEHKDRVLALSDQLLRDGIDCTIDQCVSVPDGGWPLWMEDQVEKADFVLVVCTQNYLDRFKLRGEGQGVKYEGVIVTQELHDAHTQNTKFVPILFDEKDKKFIPKILRATNSYVPRTRDGYRKLYLRLTNQHDVRAPKLGELGELRVRERKSWFGHEGPLKDLTGQWSGQISQTGRENGKIEHFKVAFDFNSVGEDVEGGFAVKDVDFRTVSYTLTGWLIQQRFVKVDFWPKDKDRTNFGTMILTMEDDGSQLSGRYVCYSARAGQIIAGDMWLKRGPDFYSCFISYAHEDKSFARRLHDALQGQGIRCWLDEHSVEPGEDIHEAIDQGIRIWDKVLLCASESSLRSWWVDAEINKAFTKEQQLMKQHGKKLLSLIPLDLDGYLFSDDWQRGWRDQVRSRKAADFTDWKSDHDKFEQQLEKLVKALRADDGGKEPPPEPKLGAEK